MYKRQLENEGIEAYIHNVNLIQPVISSGVSLRIKESDLPHALQIIESSAWLSEDIIKGLSLIHILDAKQKLQLPFLRDTLVKGVEILDIAKPDTQMLNLSLIHI